MAAIEEGWQQQEIHLAAYQHLNEIENDTRRIVGVNHGTMDEIEGIPVMKTDASLGERQSERLGELRAQRDNRAVAEALEAVALSAENGSNLFPYVIEAVRARATLGEIINVLKARFGTYMAPSGF